MSYHHRSDRFFTETEKEKIEATVKDVESRTIGEIVVMLADSSDHYGDAEITGGILGAGSLSLVLSVILFHSSLFWFVTFTFLLLWPFHLLFTRVPRLKALFIGTHRKNHAVRERALMAFFEKELYKTRENTGVLFFLSLLERKVWILADRGIYQKIGQETLNQFAGMVSQGIKGRRACDALIESIQGIGQLLSTHFPMRPGDINELPDKVITE